MRPKLLLLALCLCALGVMLGQNEPALVGMPELGVTLTGTAEHPEIVNNSGRGILGYVILSRDANGRESFMHTLKTRDLRLALVRPTSAPPSGPMATPRRAVAIKPLASFDNGGAQVQAILDAVIFDNGEFVGSDSGQLFEMLSGQVDDERTLAQAVLGQKISWDELEVLAPPRPNRARPPQDSIAEAFARLEALAPPGLQANEPPSPTAAGVIRGYDWVQRGVLGRRAAEITLADELLSTRGAYGEAAALTISDWTAKLPVVWRAK